ncbi:hypothetical protein P3S67_022121 [Capsicum chacoense]
MDTQSSKGTMVTREEGTSIGDENFVDESSIIIHQDSISNSQEIRENERQWIKSLEKRRGDIGSLQKPKIQKVPKKLHEIESNVRYYEPLVFSIGPFHHGKPELQLMEKHKELLAVQVADQDSTKERREGILRWLPTNSVSIDELYEKVKNIMHNVRGYYDEELIN